MKTYNLGVGALVLKADTRGNDQNEPVSHEVDHVLEERGSVPVHPRHGVDVPAPAGGEPCQVVAAPRREEHGLYERPQLGPVAHRVALEVHSVRRLLEGREHDG